MSVEIEVGGLEVVLCVLLVCLAAGAVTHNIFQTDSEPAASINACNSGCFGYSECFLECVKELNVDLNSSSVPVRGVGK